MEMDIKDLLMQYGVLSNKRITESQRIQYLTRLSHYFEEINYSMTILKEKYRGKSSYIGIVGDVERAKYIIATHYDTPMIDFFGRKHDPFNDKLLEKKSIKNLSFSLLICLVILFIVIKYYAMPHFTNDVFNFHDILGGILSLGLVIFTYRTIKNGGLAKRHNLVRNTSSVVAIQKFAQELKHSKSDYAFAFVDYGCIDYFGYHVLKSYLKDSTKPIILLDSVGNSEIEFDPDKSMVLKNQFKNVEFIYGTGSNKDQNFDMLNKGIQDTVFYLNDLHKK